MTIYGKSFILALQANAVPFTSQSCAVSHVTQQHSHTRMN